MQKKVVHDANGRKKETVLSAHAMRRFVPAPGRTYQRYTGDYIELDRDAPITIEAVNVAIAAALEGYEHEYPGCKIVEVKAIHKSALDMQHVDSLLYGMCDQYERDTLGVKITVEVMQTEAGEQQMIDEFRRESMRVR